MYYFKQKTNNFLVDSKDNFDLKWHLEKLRFDNNFVQYQGTFYALLGDQNNNAMIESIIKDDIEFIINGVPALLYYFLKQRCNTECNIVLLGVQSQLTTNKSTDIVAKVYGKYDPKKETCIIGVLKLNEKFFVYPIQFIPNYIPTTTKWVKYKPRVGETNSIKIDNIDSLVESMYDIQKKFDQTLKNGPKNEKDLLQNYNDVTNVLFVYRSDNNDPDGYKGIIDNVRDLYKRVVQIIAKDKGGDVNSYFEEDQTYPHLNKYEQNPILKVCWTIAICAEMLNLNAYIKNETDQETSIIERSGRRGVVKLIIDGQSMSLEYANFSPSKVTTKNIVSGVVNLASLIGLNYGASYYDQMQEEIITNVSGSLALGVTSTLVASAFMFWMLSTYQTYNNPFSSISDISDAQRNLDECRMRRTRQQYKTIEELEEKKQANKEVQQALDEIMNELTKYNTFVKSVDETSKNLDKTSLVNFLKGKIEDPNMSKDIKDMLNNLIKKIDAEINAENKEQEEREKNQIAIQDRESSDDENIKKAACQLCNLGLKAKAIVGTSIAGPGLLVAGYYFGWPMIQRFWDTVTMEYPMITGVVFIIVLVVLYLMYGPNRKTMVREGNVQANITNSDPLDIPSNLQNKTTEPFVTLRKILETNKNKFTVECSLTDRDITQLENLESNNATTCLFIGEVKLT